MHELVLIERDPTYYKTWPGLTKKKKISGLSVEEIVGKYQGFEGGLIYHFAAEDDIDKYKTNLNKLLNYENLENCYLLDLISNQTVIPAYLQSQADHLGYDVGFCDGETSAIYSSIFHEVLFGHIDELIAYKDQLNTRFLFPSKDIAAEYVHLHDQMSAQGRDVEDIVEMTIYEIWRHKY